MTGTIQYHRFFFFDTIVRVCKLKNSCLLKTLSEPFYESWSLYGWRGESGDSLIVWSLIPEQFGMWVGMFLVVAFSSSLDVAAIEMELGLPLDYNKLVNQSFIV